MTFAALMRQECGWFDDEQHSSSALSARLTGDAANLQSVWHDSFSNNSNDFNQS